MDILGVLLILLSLIGVIVGVVGLIKGSIKVLKIISRKQVGLLILACFILFIVGGAMISTGATDTPATVAGDVAKQVTDIDGAEETSSQTVKELEQEKALSTDGNGDVDEEPPASAPDVLATTTTVSRDLEVHFIDVGQADSILIKAPGGNMLIDAGNNGDADLITSYIKKQGVKTLDVVIGTHPHEDHIGSLDVVIDTFDIGKVYMPKVEHTTQTIEDVLLAIKNKGLKITAPVAGSTFNVGEVKCRILAPNSSKYDDLNNYSIVIKLEFGNTSFLFTGDAEKVSEDEMLQKHKDKLSSDVLKVGHHGSNSSTIQGFLDKVNPKYAVVMVGKNNSYEHPHKVVMNRLKEKGVTVYRTDENSTIVANSDGNNITFNTKPGSYLGSSSGGGTTGSIAPTTPAPNTKEPPNVTNNNRTVYWTPNGKSYHYTDKCSTLSRSKTILSGPLSSCPKSDPCDRCTY